MRGQRIEDGERDQYPNVESRRSGGDAFEYTVQ